MTLCGCGCGAVVNPGRRYINHHQLIGKRRVFSVEWRANISRGKTGTKLGPYSEERRIGISQGRLKGRALESYYTVEDRGFSTPCWVWRGALLKSGGYGAINRRGKVYRAHRWMYEQHRGPIPPGKHLDHLCRIKPCVNPDHLEPVTKHENELRHWAQAPKRTHCHAGHALTPENVRPNGNCRLCNLRYQRAYKARVKARLTSGPSTAGP